VFVDDVGEVANAIATVVQDGDVVLTMGAGSIGQVPAALAKGGR
jgi:UDP-N-acetylmuramate--alanine ligase